MPCCFLSVESLITTSNGWPGQLSLSATSTNLPSSTASPVKWGQLDFCPVACIALCVEVTIWDCLFEGLVVVVVPGITGSVLAVGTNENEVWGLSGRAIMNGVQSLGQNVQRLRLPKGFGDTLPEKEGEGEPDDGVRATRLMADLHVIPGLWSPIKGYNALVNKLKGWFTAPTAAGQVDNLIEFPYDWRLSNVVSARMLKASVVPALERWRADTGNPDAKLVLVCHSMGGLVARWFLEVEGGWELTRWLITLGTPYQGRYQPWRRSPSVCPSVWGCSV